MGGHSSTVIDRLVDEWEELLARGVVDAVLCAWAEREPALRRFSEARQIVGFLADRRQAPDQHDEVLRALLRLSVAHPLAARLLLMRFLPLVQRLSRRHGPLERDEWVALLVATAFEVICRYPLASRPERIAANIACDIRKRAYAVLAARRRAQQELVRPHAGLEGVADPDSVSRLARVELADALRRAIDRGVVDAATVALVVVTRVIGVPVMALAAGDPEAAATLRQRRRRAERRLAALLAAVVS